MTTLRPLPRSRLDRVLPPLVEDLALVVLVPVGEDAQWSARVAWEVARATAAGRPTGRRAVALVDLCSDAPRLHQVKGVDQAPGIAETFASDASLSDVAREIEGVHFVPAGATLADPTGLVGSPRWSRLQAGFKSEGALLLVYLPAGRLDGFGAMPDGVLALAPTGVDLGSPDGRTLIAVRTRGTTLLGVVRERWTAPTALPRVTSRQRVRPVMVALAAAFAIVTGALLARAKSFRADRPEIVGHDRPLVPATDATPVLPAEDSSAWTVQLAAYGAPERARAHVDRLLAAGLAAFVSPRGPDASGAVWYRVMAGAYPTRDAAVVAREMCWRRGLAKTGEGEPLRAPYSLALTRSSDAARLRAAGQSPVRWGPHGPVLVGPFEHPEEAATVQAQLSRAGITTTIVTRTERTP